MKEEVFEKLKNMSCAEVQEAWKSLGNSNLRDDDLVNESEGMTMLDWSQAIFIELSRRGLPTVRKDGER